MGELLRGNPAVTKDVLLVVRFDSSRVALDTVHDQLMIGTPVSAHPKPLLIPHQAVLVFKMLLEVGLDVPHLGPPHEHVDGVGQPGGVGEERGHHVDVFVVDDLLSVEPAPLTLGLETYPIWRVGEKEVGHKPITRKRVHHIKAIAMIQDPMLILVIRTQQTNPFLFFRAKITTQQNYPGRSPVRSR